MKEYFVSYVAEHKEEDVNYLPITGCCVVELKKGADALIVKKEDLESLANSLKKGRKADNIVITNIIPLPI